MTLMEGLREAEENILECLGSGHRLLYNLAATKKLASVKKQHEEIVEGWVLIKNSSVDSTIRGLVSVLNSVFRCFVYAKRRKDLNLLGFIWNLRFSCMFAYS